MFSSKFLTVLLFTVVTPTILAGTPQGYGYGDMTETVFGASTAEPAYTDNTPYPGVPPLTTITNSVTLTKPVTVTTTVTRTVSPECSSETEIITTISGTTSTTLTTEITVVVSEGPTPTTRSTVVPQFSGGDVSSLAVITISLPTVSTTGSVASDTTTSCSSITTSGEVDGVTESLSGTPSTLFINSNTETSSVRSGASTGIVATHTPMPLPTIVISTGAQWMVDARILTGAAILPFWVLALAI
ncbi:hypothetical protein F4679DRAFT_589995 [Xylaria curta]|nr:hypothetical protein F4679DRAFT_589995 [Xylaria curta]